MIAARGLAAVVALATGCGGDSEPARCLTPIVVGSELVLDSAGAPPQIHAALGFDGSRIWLAYNLPDADGGFDSFVRRFECDGTPVGDPVPVTASTGGNDVDPALAIGGDAVGVAWSVDRAVAMNNLDLVFRGLDRDGVPLTGAETVVETERAGTPVPGNVLSPAVAALPDGTFAIAAVRGLDETGTFQAFVQRIAGDGALIGGAVDPAVESGVTHRAPALVADGDGAIHLAYSRSVTADDSAVVRTRIAAGSDTAEPSPPTEVAPGGGANLHLTAGGELLIAHHTDADDREIVLATAAGDSVSFGAAGRIDHTPVIATAPDGTGAVAYYRIISGFQNELVLQPFSYGAGAPVLGAEMVMPIAPAAPYAPAITYVQDGAYMVAWSQGTSPDFVLAGMLVVPGG